MKEVPAIAGETGVDGQSCVTAWMSINAEGKIERLSTLKGCIHSPGYLQIPLRIKVAENAKPEQLTNGNFKAFTHEDVISAALKVVVNGVKFEAAS